MVKMIIIIALTAYFFPSMSHLYVVNVARLLLIVRSQSVGLFAENVDWH